MTGSIDNNFKTELNRMEMLHSDGGSTSLYFVSDKIRIKDARIRIALEQAYKYKADAVFFRIFPEDLNRSPLPQVYLYQDTALDLDESEYAKIHCRLWNAGIVPLVFILTAGQVRVINCRQEPEVNKDSQEPVFTPFRSLEKIVSADRAFAAREIAAGTIWEDITFKNDFVLEKTAYFKLLSHLKEFREELLALKILSEATVNRILVMAILVKYLNDRHDTSGNRVFEKGFFRQFSHADSQNLDALFREKGSCIRLFDYLSERFNGGIFELPDNEKAELQQADLSPIADFLKGDLEPKGQRLFWPLYSFEDLPVELISNLYEEFLAKKDKGVVYTPPMLVDFLLDQCLPLDSESLSWKILDPACGSGIFLVGAFKRLIQCWRMANDWEQPTYRDLQNILKKSIFGFDRAPEAVLVTAFSLCVALCDELEPLVIWNELKFDDLRTRNLQAKDFFEIVESEEFAHHFDLVIGNPPFESTLTTKAAKKVEKAAAKARPTLPDRQLALLFLEQSFRLARSESAVCLIQPAGPLLYNGNALPFRGYLFERFAIDQIFDFTPLDGVLFSNAQVATAAIVGRNAPASKDKILHVTFRRTRAIKEKLLFELDPYDFHWITRKDVAKNQYAWKANLLGGGRLHRLLNRLLSGFPTLGEYLEQKRKNDGWQYGEGYSVGCGSYLNARPDAKELAELSPKELKQRFGLKRTPKLAPWITGKRNLPPKALTHKGINCDHANYCEEIFFEEPRKTVYQIFLPPHVLIREVIKGLAVPAVYCDKELVFSKQVVGIYAPPGEEESLKKIAAFLNTSDLSAFLVAIVSSRTLISRVTSILQADILALPFPDDNTKFTLTTWEKVLLEDVMEHLIEFRRKGEDSFILNEVHEADLRKFGEFYCDILNPVYKQFRPLEPISIGSFVCYPFCYGEEPQIELPELDRIIPFLNDLLRRRHGSRLFVNRILRLYEQNVIFMIKPNQKRYWLRSIALRDADETLIDLLQQGY